MNPELLLNHFDRISDAPDAIPRLRSFILDLAVRGRLVEQDPVDESVVELLLRNDQARRAIAEIDRRADIARQMPLAADCRWNTPLSWNWCTLTDLVLFIDYRGKTPTKTEKGVRLITAKNVKKGFINSSPEEFLSKPDYHAWMTRGLPKEGDILFTTEAPMGNAAVVRLPERFALAQRVICFRPYGAVVPDFLTFQLLSEPFQSILIKTATGLTAKGIKAAKLMRLPVAVPPLAEQRRIVAKVVELMALCGRLESARAERESRRDRLTVPSLRHLNNGADAEALREHANFFLGNLSHLTPRPDQIKQLRETILKLAVRGRLVPQDPNDGSTPEFLKRIKLTNSESVPFPVPPSWSWISVRQIGESRLGKMLDKAKNKGTPRRYLRNVNVRWFDFDLSDVFKMRFEDDEIEEFSLRSGDVLICEGGEPGRAAVWDEREEKIYFQKAIHRVRFPEGVNSHFFLNAVRESTDSGRLAGYFTGVGIKHFTGKGLSTFVFPLPPLAEQRRIVAKVNELMTLCDQLEAQLTTAKTETSRLLEAVLYHALNDAVESPSTTRLTPQNGLRPASTHSLQ